MHLISLYYEQDRINEAFEKAMEALNRSPDNTLVWTALADLYSRQKEYGKAEACLDRLLCLSPNDLGALLKLCRITVQQEALEKALRILVRINVLVEMRDDIQELRLKLKNPQNVDNKQGTESILQFISSIESFLSHQVPSQNEYSLSTIINGEAIKELSGIAARFQAEGRKEHAATLFNKLRTLDPGFHTLLS